MTLRERILQAQDLSHEVVEVPEWNCTVVIWQMGERQRRAFELWCAKQDQSPPDLAMFYARLIVECARDIETGEPIFSADDAGALSEKCSAALRRLQGVAMRLNHLEEEQRDDLKKNSPEPGDSANGSPSEPPSPSDTTTST